MSETITNFLLYTTTLFLVLNIIQLFILGLHILKEKKKKTIAVILDKDKKTISSMQVNPSQRFFKDTHLNKEYAYNLVEPYIKYLNTNFLLYELGKADPIDPLDYENSRLDGDTYKSILDNEALMKINNYKGSSSLLDFLKPKYLLIGAVAILTILFLTGTIQL